MADIQTKTISAIAANKHHKYTMKIDEASVDRKNNTSTVRYTLFLEPVVEGYNWYVSNGIVWEIQLEGEHQRSGMILDYDGYATKNIVTGYLTIPHDNEGNKTIKIGFRVLDYLNYSYTPGDAAADTTMVLTHITNKAYITSAENFNDEGNPTFTYVNTLGNSASSLQACLSFNQTDIDIPYRDVSKAGGTYTFELTDAERKILREKCANANSITIYYYLRTIHNGEFSFDYVPKTLTIINANSAITDYWVRDTSPLSFALTGDENKVIKNYNTIEAGMTIDLKKEAKVKEQYIANSLKAYNGSSAIIKDTADARFSFTLIDSRGKASIEDVVLDMVEYIKPTCNLNIAAPDAEGKVSFTIEGNVFKGNFGVVDNTCAVYYKYKAGDGEFTEWKPADYIYVSDNHTYNADVTVEGLDYTKAHTFVAKVVDQIQTVESIEKVVRTIPIFDWGENDFNFNVPVTVNGDVEISGNIEASGSLRVQGNPVADYIIEQGNNGSYGYRKWASGLLEAWRTSTSTVAVQASNTYFNHYYQDGLSLTVNGNAAQFKTVQNINLNINKRGSIGFWQPILVDYTINDGAVTVNYLVTNPGIASTNIQPYVYIIGTWK